MGPNSAVGSGTLLYVIEKQIDYAVEATLKIQRERLKSMEVKKTAVDDFDEYIEVSLTFVLLMRLSLHINIQSYFPKVMRSVTKEFAYGIPQTVFGKKCRSWYKMGKEEGRVVALWPGKSLQLKQRVLKFL